jgi:hypothetical protein
MDTETGLCWAGFANKKLRERIEPVMRRVLGEWAAKRPITNFQ